MMNYRLRLGKKKVSHGEVNDVQSRTFLTGNKRGLTINIRSIILTTAPTIITSKSKWEGLKDVQVKMFNFTGQTIAADILKSYNSD